MTGIERLREFAKGCRLTGQRAYSNAIGDIADQVERERACDADTIENVRLIVGGVVDEMERHTLGHEGMDDSPVARWARELREALKSDTSDGRDAQKPSWHDPSDAAGVTSDAPKVTRDPAEDVSMSAYDLLPEEDREAIAWVREHGGLDSVKKLLDWVVGHCSTKQQLDFDFWLSGRVMHELGFEEDRADRDEVERRLLARLMPEGMEWLVEAWPRFEDDSPVRLLDDFERYGEENGVSVVTIYADGSFALNFRAYSKGERVNRPAPKVLDADGVEIRMRDTVYLLPGDWCDKFPLYRCHEWDAMKVLDLSPNHDTGRIECETSFSSVVCYPYPSQLTHRAPVLAADGRPLREGETVYGVNTGYEYTVTGFNPTTDEDGDPCVMVVCKTESDRRVDIPSNCLTHERPVADTWERLEEDATVSPEAYCAKRGIDFSDVDGQHRVLDEVTERMALDLVRRAKKLAGVSE